MSKRRISILGSTGSVGCSTVDLIKRHPDRFDVVALSANKNTALLAEQTRLLKPSFIAVADVGSYAALKDELAGVDVEIACGEQAVIDAAGVETYWTMASIVGAAGLKPTLAAIRQGRVVAFANKECLVCAGDLVMAEVKKYRTTMLPVDSEHNAIFQVFSDTQRSSIERLILTASGGPFRTADLAFMKDVTPAQAVAHPNWDMGRKISVDSATMMNKGLEFIEAKWLFNVEAEDIQVVLHPQSIIHSMVQYKDGSVIAQMGNPDMRTPIAHALAFPERIEAGVEPLDFFNCAAFEFEKVDFEKYPNLELAIEACKLGQGACTALNAANEVAVDAFLSKQIKFTEIYKINETSVNKFVSEKVVCIDDVVSLDSRVRKFALSLIANHNQNKIEEDN